MEELYAICRPYPSQVGDYNCYRCHRRIKDEVEFTVHIMKTEGMEFRHYHLKCAPKKKLNKLLSAIKHKKRSN